MLLIYNRVIYSILAPLRPFGSFYVRSIATLQLKAPFHAFITPLSLVLLCLNRRFFFCSSSVQSVFSTTQSSVLTFVFVGFTFWFKESILSPGVGRMERDYIVCRYTRQLSQAFLLCSF